LGKSLENMEEKRIDFLKERAREFFEEAKELFNKKRYNLSAFNLEQAIQLFLKYLNWQKIWRLAKNSLFVRVDPRFGQSLSIQENFKVLSRK